MLDDECKNMDFYQFNGNGRCGCEGEIKWIVEECQVISKRL